MSGAIWWLSNQRTSMPTSAMKTAAQAKRLPSRPKALPPSPSPPTAVPTAPPAVTAVRSGDDSRPTQ